jgi:chemotaxis protein MotB
MKPSDGLYVDSYKDPLEGPGRDVQQEYGAEEPWLVSYADLMTLLFGFFAMLFTFATFQEDKEDYIKVRKDIAKYFGATSVSAPDKLNGAVTSELKKLPALKEVLVKPKQDGLEINLLSSVLFTAGKSEVAPASVEPLSKLAEVIKSTSRNALVTIEGHSDDKLAKGSVYPSNWELSAARAAAIVRIFERAGVRPNQLGAIGYGDTRPAFPSHDTAGRPIPDNQALNRRVVIKVSLPNQAGTERKPSQLFAPTSSDQGSAVSAPARLEDKLEGINK